MAPVTGADRVGQGGRQDHLTLLNSNAKLNLLHSLRNLNLEDDDKNTVVYIMTLQSTLTSMTPPHS